MSDEVGFLRGGAVQRGGVVGRSIRGASPGVPAREGVRSAARVLGARAHGVRGDRIERGDPSLEDRRESRDLGRLLVRDRVGLERLG